MTGSIPVISVSTSSSESLRAGGGPGGGPGGFRSTSLCDKIKHTQVSPDSQTEQYVEINDILLQAVTHAGCSVFTESCVQYKYSKTNGTSF